MKSNSQELPEITAAKTLQLFYRNWVKKSQMFPSPEELARHANNLGLDIAPIAPQKAIIASSTQRANFLGLYTAKYRNLGRIQLENLKYISFAEFMQKLNVCIKQYIEITKQGPKKKTLLLIDKWHSQHWVASLAVKHLPTTSIPDYSFDPEHRLFSDLVLPHDVERIIMFDDWSLSGTQVSEIMRRINKVIESQGIDRNIEVIFIIPYITRQAEESVTLQYPNLKLIKAEYLLKQNEILELTNEAQICRINLNNRNVCGMHDIWGCLVFSDWSIPDAMSMPGGFISGHPSIWLMDPSIAKMPAGSPIPGYPILTETNKPYKEITANRRSKITRKLGY